MIFLFFGENSVISGNRGINNQSVALESNMETNDKHALKFTKTALEALQPRRAEPHPCLPMASP